MDTYYDRLNAFFKFNAAHPMPPDDQLVMLHLLHHNNRLNNIGQFYLTDLQLAEQTHLSKSKITAIKRRLKNLGLLNFKTNPKAPAAGTQYTLPPLKKSDAKSQVGGNYRSENSEEIKKAWRECAGENLTGGVAFGMIQFENEHGTKAVVDAIFKAHQSGVDRRHMFNYVRAVLENKGGAERARTYRNTNGKIAADAAGRPVKRNDEFDFDVPPEYRKYLAGAQAV